MESEEQPARICGVSLFCVSLVRTQAALAGFFCFGMGVGACRVQESPPVKKEELEVMDSSFLSEPLEEDEEDEEEKESLRETQNAHVLSAQQDIRLAPRGTPAENARALRRLAIAISDGPALGEIGRSGIHIDRLEVGVGWKRSRCERAQGQFSVKEEAQVNLCFRVVHPRMDEKLMVLWQKEGKTTRRRALTVRSMHAFRTRAYLALRPEYVGKWTVKVFSPDNAELGSANFEVVE